MYGLGRAVCRTGQQSFGRWPGWRFIPVSQPPNAMFSRPLFPCFRQCFSRAAVFTPPTMFWTYVDNKAAPVTMSKLYLRFALGLRREEYVCYSDIARAAILFEQFWNTSCYIRWCIRHLTNKSMRIIHSLFKLKMLGPKNKKGEEPRFFVKASAGVIFFPRARCWIRGSGCQQNSHAMSKRTQINARMRFM